MGGRLKALAFASRKLQPGSCVWYRGYCPSCGRALGEAVEEIIPPPTSLSNRELRWAVMRRKRASAACARPTSGYCGGQLGASAGPTTLRTECRSGGLDRRVADTGSGSAGCDQATDGIVGARYEQSGAIPKRSGVRPPQELRRPPPLLPGTYFKTIAPGNSHCGLCNKLALFARTTSR
jgi:hypothetical protein